MSDGRHSRNPDDPPRPQPPRWAEALLERRLPAEVADAVLGDLHVEHRQRAQRRGRFAADAWYWWQALTMRTGALRRAAQRLAAVRPTPDRNRPRHTLSPRRDPFMTFADVRYALRRLTATPGFTAVAVLSLGLGIGANTAMFSLVNAVLLRELPVEDPGTLVEVYTSEADGFAYSTSSYPDFQDLRAGPEVFEGVVASRSFIARVDIDGAPQVVFGELISWDYFQTLGIEMVLGRSFAEEEDRTPGAHPVVVLGYKTWSQRFGSDPEIVGTSVFVNGRPYTVVGVAPSAFTGSLPAVVTSLYVPMSMTDVVMGTEQLSRRGSRSTFLKARLRPDVSVSEANAALAAFSTALQERYPETNAHRVMTAMAIGDFALHPSVDRLLAPVAVLLLGVVGLVPLIACTNLASFLLARAEDRRREIAVRLALGAGRRRLVGQLLVETTLLAVLGGGFGLIVAEWTLGVLMALRPPIPIPVDIEVGLDGSVLVFTLAVSVLAGLAFGLLPALQATRPDLAPTLKGSGNASASRRRVDLRSAMVVTQVALSFVLLIGAGLFVRSLQKAQAIDPGFDTGPGAIVWPMLDLAGYQSDDEKRSFYTEYREALLAHPSVTGVAIADRLPLGIAVQTANYLLPGVPSETPDGDHDNNITVVNGGQLETHEEEIVSGETDVMALRDEFLQIFYDNGHTEEEKLKIEQLFWEIVGDIEYASIMGSELDATAGVMMDMSFMNLTPEEWEKRRQKALQENAEGDLEEALEDMVQYTYSAGGVVAAAPEISLNSVKDIENKSGIHLERIAIPNEPGRYVYKIAFPHFKGVYEPFMEIRFPPGSKDLSQATYVIEDRYKDPGAGSTGRPLRRAGGAEIPTYEYAAKDISSVLARLQLDKLLTDVVKESGDPGLTKESVNALLKDQDLQRMTEQLLGFQFKDKPLLPPHLRKCKNFLKVLARADGRSFQERVKDMKIALNDAQLAPHLKLIFSRPGSEVMDVQTVIGEAKLKRGGIKIE